jgi:EAL domain-containing protein (putative c-di-GMP-specific phosphodiesterase class I)
VRPVPPVYWMMVRTVLGQYYVRAAARISAAKLVDSLLTNAINGPAPDLRLKVTAVRAETGEQTAFLRERGCDLARGYFLSRPFPAFLSSNSARSSAGSGG